MKPERSLRSSDSEMTYQPDYDNDNDNDNDNDRDAKGAL